MIFRTLAQENFLIFQGRYIQNPGLTKLSYILGKEYSEPMHNRTSLYFWKWSSLALHFSYISGRNFPSSKIKKNSPLSSLLYSRKWNFLAPSLENVLYLRRPFQKFEKQTEKPTQHVKQMLCNRVKISF